MKCSGKIYGDYRDVSGRVYPCSRNATIERDGKWYCWQHDPERIRTDKEERRARYKAAQDRKGAWYARRAATHQACEGIPTEKLEAGLIQRLLEALEMAEHSFAQTEPTTCGLRPDEREAWAVVKAAVARVKGQGQ